MSEERLTQCKQVLDHLKSRGTLTSMQAFRMFDITRLPDRARDLRAAGVAVKSTMIRLPSGRRCAQYSL